LYDTAPESVHHTAWPCVETEWQDAGLIDEMERAMRVAALGRAARSSAGIKLRQPLRRAIVASREHSHLSRLGDIVADELNVQELEWTSDEAALVEYRLLPDSRTLGPRLGPLFPMVREALQSADAPAIVRALQAGQPWRLAVEDQEVELAPGEVLIQSSPRAGLAVASEGGLTVAVDIQLTPALIQEGLAREAVRRVQELRKNAGLEMDERIHLYFTATPALASALEAHAQYVRDETLADTLTAGLPPAEAATATDTFEGETLAVALTKAGNSSPRNMVAGDGKRNG
jgi:isoleucyl-tRNA synthetase